MFLQSLDALRRIAEIICPDNLRAASTVAASAASAPHPRRLKTMRGSVHDQLCACVRAGLKYQEADPANITTWQNDHHRADADHGHMSVEHLKTPPGRNSKRTPVPQFP